MNGSGKCAKEGIQDIWTHPLANFDRVPVVDLHRENIAQYMDEVKEAISSSSFVAVDCELSGLGDRKKLNAPGIDDRYKNTGLVAKTRSIIALGLSTYRLENIHNRGGEQTVENGTEADQTEGKSWTYRVQTYNIMVLCAEDYIVEPGSLRFLVEHDFDFHKQYSLGVSYLRGNDRKEEKDQPLREIFAHLVKSRKALVLHNGLIDLIFLYHNFYAALPDKLGTFIADLSDMFPSGIYDTKYIADYVCRTQASFLEFVFRKEQKVNCEKFSKNRPHVKLMFKATENKDTDWRHCGDQNCDEEVDVCLSYAHHGHCPKGNSCPKSHDIDQIIKFRNMTKKNKKRTHSEAENGGTEPSSNGDESKDETATDNPPATVNSGGHRAGFDAFMTGFAFTTFLVHNSQIPQHPVDFEASSIKADVMVNRIYLVCKDFPMLVQKSAYAKNSGEHVKKMEKLSQLAV